MFLNLCNIHKKEKIDEGITSFSVRRSVRRSVCFAFLGKSALCMTQEQDGMDRAERERP